MASLGATAVISTSVPMRNWARLTVTDADAGLDAGGEAGGGMGVIAQAGENGKKGRRKKNARRFIGNGANEKQRGCHGARGRAPECGGARGGGGVGPAR